MDRLADGDGPVFRHGAVRWEGFRPRFLSSSLFGSRGDTTGPGPVVVHCRSGFLLAQTCHEGLALSLQYVQSVGRDSSAFAARLACGLGGTPPGRVIRDGAVLLDGLLCVSFIHGHSSLSAEGSPDGFLSLGLSSFLGRVSSLAAAGESPSEPTPRMRATARKFSVAPGLADPAGRVMI